MKIRFSSSRSIHFGTCFNISHITWHFENENCQLEYFKLRFTQVKLCFYPSNWALDLQQEPPKNFLVLRYVCLPLV
jgi:hypothetical protein